MERFLIDQRDEYLKYSSRNYTVEQKQFNNMLTEQLIALAEKHGYVFDPDDFNFVGIRDRIRCYYKSYVQTARKRGLQLPIDKVKEERKREQQAKHHAAVIRGGGEPGEAMDDDDDNNDHPQDDEEMEDHEEMETQDKEERE